MKVNTQQLDSFTSKLIQDVNNFKEEISVDKLSDTWLRIMELYMGDTYLSDECQRIHIECVMTLVSRAGFYLAHHHHRGAYGIFVRLRSRIDDIMKLLEGIEQQQVAQINENQL